MLCSITKVKTIHVCTVLPPGVVENNVPPGVELRSEGICDESFSTTRRIAIFFAFVGLLVEWHAADMFHLQRAISLFTALRTYFRANYVYVVEMRAEMTERLTRNITQHNNQKQLMWLQKLAQL